ncbi:MAG TPA: MaoC family dehydratase N-terminal domain-containing protein [Streptosporangiaceae bacterium]|jgi:acyl dehydratase|nr:MaoC family dehydratase N-terminal domain-containing protein [Streptosporangiaceae bacterium]
MPINRDYIGRTFPPTDPYEVSRVKIREFADAIGDSNPVYRDRAAAQASGHPDVVAPPTFPVIFALGDTGSVLTSPELGINFAMVVHGEQRFVYERPLYAGDVVVCESTITEIRAAGRNELLTIETEVKTVDGAHICTAYNSLVERAGAA